MVVSSVFLSIKSPFSVNQLQMTIWKDRSDKKKKIKQITCSNTNAHKHQWVGLCIWLFHTCMQAEDADEQNAISSLRLAVSSLTPHSAQMNRHTFVSHVRSPLRSCHRIQTELSQQCTASSYCSSEKVVVHLQSWTEFIWIDCISLSFYQYLMPLPTQHLIQTIWPAGLLYFCLLSMYY